MPNAAAFRLLVALLPGRDLFVHAKDLFVETNGKTAKQVPKALIGRRLSQEEAKKLLGSNVQCQ